MQEPAPPVFPLFRSRITASVLVRTHVGGGEYSITELAGAAGTNRGNMAREVDRLEHAAVLTSRRVGRTKLVSANQRAPFYRALRDLVTITMGPAEVLGEELAAVDGIDRAEVFGSWAARVLGEPGPSPVDIDLLVIGRPDRDDLQDAVNRAKIRLGREVNSVVVSPKRWESSDDAFLAELRARPRVPVIKSVDEQGSDDLDDQLGQRS
jgi:predicted nucleotidyltransferase